METEALDIGYGTLDALLFVAGASVFIGATNVVCHWLKERLRREEPCLTMEL